MSLDTLRRDIGEVESQQESLRQQGLLLEEYRRTRDRQVVYWKVAIVAISLLLLGTFLLFKGLEPAPTMGSPIVYEQKVIMLNETRNIPIIQTGLQDCIELRNEAGEVYYRCRVRP